MYELCHDTVQCEQKLVAVLSVDQIKRKTFPHESPPLPPNKSWW
jgi:hypothetical protein